MLHGKVTANTSHNEQSIGTGWDKYMRIGHSRVDQLDNSTGKQARAGETGWLLR